MALIGMGWDGICVSITLAGIVGENIGLKETRDTTQWLT